MRILPSQKINSIQRELDKASNIYVSGADYSSNPIGKQITYQPVGFWGRITGVLSCSTSVNPSSLTDVAATCCTTVGSPTSPHVAYTFIEVQPDQCGRWKDGTKTGIAYEVNDMFVSLNAVVWLTIGFADDYRFVYGSSSVFGSTGIPYKCVSIPSHFDCVRDANGNATGQTMITYTTIATLDVGSCSTGGVIS